MRFQINPENFESCPQYNDWLDQQYTEQGGSLNILGFQPRPSYVLHSLSIDTYKATFADFLADYQDNLKESLFNEYPTPIAHYYYRFENGYENDLQRLHLLRDSWEAVVDVLHAIAVGECRFRQVSLADPIAFSHFLSDRVADRLLSVERIINHASTQGINLVVAEVVSVDVLGKMRELNRTRNAFSHSAAQSESQARNWISECYEDVIDILDDLQGLMDVSIVRYLSQVDGFTLRVELFRGHGFTRTIKTMPLTADQVRDSQRYFRQGQILLSHKTCMFGLLPLIYYREDASGHITKLCMFRKKQGEAPDRILEYEVVGEAARWSEDRRLFKPELDELRGLFGLGPD